MCFEIEHKFDLISPSQRQLLEQWAQIQDGRKNSGKQIADVNVKIGFHAKNVVLILKGGH